MIVGKNNPAVNTGEGKMNDCSVSCFPGIRIEIGREERGEKKGIDRLDHRLNKNTISVEKPYDAKAGFDFEAKIEQPRLARSAMHHCSYELYTLLCNRC